MANIIGHKRPISLSEVSATTPDLRLSGGFEGNATIKTRGTPHLKCLTKYPFSPYIVRNSHPKTEYLGCLLCPIRHGGLICSGVDGQSRGKGTSDGRLVGALAEFEKRFQPIKSLVVRSEGEPLHEFLSVPAAHWFEAV